MMRVSVWYHGLDESWLRLATQLGVECVDFGSGAAFPSVKRQGYPDLDEVLHVKRALRAWGLEMNRVTLPDLTTAFIEGRPEGERELENACRALQVYAEAGAPIARQRFAGDANPGDFGGYPARQRGGVVSRGEYRHQSRPPEASSAQMDVWWERFVAAYGRLAPIAAETGIRLAVHPSDTPYAGTPFDGLGMHRVLDAFPGRSVGLLYCVGTRAEAGGAPLVLDEINAFGRKGRIFAVHFRNVRGSLATAGGFEETLLDDGDLNMYRVLLELRRVGYEGCLNPDHIPPLEGDGALGGVGLAYSVGYIKALLAALSMS
jgi:mannonate dehydratase